MTSFIFAGRRAILTSGVVLALGSASPLFEASATAMTSQTASSEQNKQIVATAFDRWTAGGSDFFNEVLAPDVVWTIEGSGPSAGTIKGRDALIERAVRPLVSRLTTPVRPVSKQIWADGDHVIIRWVGEGMARDSEVYRNTYAWIFRMEGGRAVEVRAFLDLVPYDDVLRRIPASDEQGVQR